jgi:hypothetical protein
MLVSLAEMQLTIMLWSQKLVHQQFGNRQAVLLFVLQTPPHRVNGRAWYRHGVRLHRFGRRSGERSGNCPRGIVYPM